MDKTRKDNIELETCPESFRDETWNRIPYTANLKPYTKIRCVHFNDDKRIDILDKKVIDRGIIGNIEFAVEYLKERVPVRYEINKLARDEFPEYPSEAYRETIVHPVR